MSATRLTRSYSITNDSDRLNTTNGRCPDYALTWESNDHSHHWPLGHDYYLGNGQNLDNETHELREILSRRLVNGTLGKHIVFCDLDGVLADFEQGIVNKFNKHPEQINSKVMWGGIQKTKTFFETLPWMPRGRDLWNRIQKYHPIILTGVPNNNSSIIAQKRKWCQRELGEDVDVITCMSKNKPKYCLPDAILIDDRMDNMRAWNEKSGKFILYNENVLEDILYMIDSHMTDEISEK